MSFNSLAVFVKMLAGLVSIKVISVWLGPSALALLGNFKNVKNAVKSFATLGVQSGVVTYTAATKNNSKQRAIVLSTAFYMILFSSLFLGIFSILFSKSIGWYLFKTNDYQICILAFGLLLPLYAFQVFSIAVINGLQKFKALVLLSIIASVFALLLTVVFIVYYKTLGALMALAVVESLIVFVYLIYFVKNRLLLPELKWSLVSKSYAKKLTSYSLMTFITALIIPFSMLFLRNNLINHYGLVQAGLWEAVNRISDYYLLILISGIGMYYLPKLSKIDNDRAFRQEIVGYFKTFMPLCLLMFLVIYGCRSLIVDIALSTSFASVKNLLIYQLIGDFFKIASYAFAQQFLAKRLTIPYIVTEVLFFAVYLLFAQLFIVEYGVQGVLYGYCLAYVAYFLMMLFCFRKALNISF